MKIIHIGILHAVYIIYTHRDEQTRDEQTRNEKTSSENQEHNTPDNTQNSKTELPPSSTSPESSPEKMQENISKSELPSSTSPETPAEKTQENIFKSELPLPHYGTHTMEDTDPNRYKKDPNESSGVTDVVGSDNVLVPYSYKFNIYDDDDESFVPLISSKNANVVPDQYIVIFKKNIDQDEINSHYNQIRQLIAQTDDGIININEIRHTYDFNDFKGYSGRFSAKLLNNIRQSSEVDYVEKDQIVQLNYKKNKRKRYKIQYDPPWGLARISARVDDWPSDTGRYWYHESGGNGVTVYIIDTGINIHHDDFEGRAIWGIDYSNDNYDNNDGNGHVAGKTYGVAKKATMVAVKVLNSYGYGYISDILKGIEWSVIQHKSKQMSNDHKGSVINMSLGGDKSIATNDAVNAGVDILSSWIGSENNVVATLSGTSMSSPHISGLCALFISMGIAKHPKDVKNKIIEHSTRGALKGIPNLHTPNRLAYNAWWWNDIFDLKLSKFDD
ncbi:6347_t:CDS:2 [Racocetra fulgida]|uniref:6347_t:CDS:1 n=1 Tax=Racocetra fulgida TaxID=60492 RepID=A0A9N8VT59_9GLOM|nr:6347_t:CDS:2 [Racocetra fulgida]